MELGDYQIHPIETGEFALDGGAMFGVVPKPLWSRRIPVDERNRIDMRLRCLLIREGRRNILVDTGMGSRWDEKSRDIYRLSHERYSLEKSLAAHGLTCEAITDVILTHLHFDHAGGAATKLPDGRMVPTFPNATHHLQKTHFEYAAHATEKDRASFRREDYECLMATKQLRLLTGPEKVFRELELVLMNGHTVDQQLVRITAGGKTLLYCCDLFPTSVHLSPPWIMAYDNHPMTTLAEKKAVLKEAVPAKWVLFFEHCPLVAAGVVQATEKGFQVEPIDL